MANNRSTEQIGTIESYGLSRQELHFYPTQLRLLGPYLGKGQIEQTDFEVGAITRPRPGSSKLGDTHELVWYGVSPTLNAYMTVSANLTDGENIGAERLTAMRYREMILDNVRAAGGDTTKMQWLGVAPVSNDFARASIMRAFHRVGLNIMEPGSVEVTPADAEGFQQCVENNPLCRGQQRLVEQYPVRTGGAFIKRFIFESKGYKVPASGEIPYGQPELHIITELGRPTTS